MKDLIKKILKEDFEWVNNIPSKVNTEDLEMEKKYVISWTNDEWLGSFINRDIRSGDVFAFETGGTNGISYLFKHERTGTTLVIKSTRMEDYGINITEL